MPVHFPLLFNNLKPKQMKLIKDIANTAYPYDDVYVRNWDDFLSKFNFLTEVSNLSIIAVDSKEISTSFINLKPIYMNVEFKCSDKIASYLKTLISNINPEDKFIGVTPPISIGASVNNYTSFFVTEINVNSVKWFGNDIPVSSTNSVELKGYTFYKSNQNEPMDFYDDDYSDK